MDLTPQVINEIEFSMARRGYDPDQVDEFLEKVAVAVSDLNAGLAEARERVAAAERRAEEAEAKASQRPERVVEVHIPPEQSASAAEVAAAAEAELETLKRTLVLAQKTADAAVREAEVEARRIVGAAEADARSAHDETRRRLVEELTALEANRDALRDDVRSIERHLDEQRLRLRGSIAELQRILEDPSRLKASTPPTAVTDPTPVAVATPFVEPAAAEPPAAQADAEEPEPALADEPPAAKAKAPQEPARPRLRAEAAKPAAAPPAEGDADADDEAWARFGPGDDEGANTQPVPRITHGTPPNDIEEPADDAYLAELRKAMLDDTGAPDVEEGDLLGVPGERAGRSRFRRR